MALRCIAWQPQGERGGDASIQGLEVNAKTSFDCLVTWRERDMVPRLSRVCRGNKRASMTGMSSIQTQ